MLKSTLRTANTGPNDLATFRNSSSGVRPSGVSCIRDPITALRARSLTPGVLPAGHLTPGSANAAFGQFGHGLVVVGCHETGACVVRERREAILLAQDQRQDGQIALQEGLLIRCELDPASRERVNNRWAQVVADVDDCARALVDRLH